MKDEHCYETAEVPIPVIKRYSKIAGSVAVCGIGIYLFITTLAENGFHDLNSIVASGFFIGIGSVAVVRSLRNTHERRLTPAGTAAKAEDAARERMQILAEFSSFLGWITRMGILLLILFAAAPALEEFRGRISVYPVTCSFRSVDAGGCIPGSEHAEPVTTFIVDVSHQFVVADMEHAPAPIRLAQCVVADVRNWSCAQSAEPYARRIIMRDGDLSYDPPWGQRVEQYASRLDWWRIWLTHRHS